MPSTRLSKFAKRDKLGEIDLSIDRRVTAKFWQIVAPPDGVPFEDSLKVALGVDLENSVLTLDGSLYQFQSYSNPDDELLFGDVIRLQSEAFPSLVEAGKKPTKLPLGEGKGLGHHTAFVFDPARRLLGFEIKPAAAGLVKVLQIVSEIAKHPVAVPLPVLTTKAIQDLAGTKNGVLKIKVGDPKTLAGVDPELENVRDNLTYLKEMVDGAYVYVAIGVGPRRDGLAPNKLMKVVGWLLGERDAKRGKVRTIKVGQPDEEESLLDFIKAQFKYSDQLKLTGDPDLDWPTRRQFLRSALAKAKAHVRDN